MSNAQSKLDALEAILGVDETEDLERPELRRSVGEILEGAAPTKAEQAVETPDSAREVNDSKSSSDKQPERIQRPPGLESTVRRPIRNSTGSSEAKARSSALLPVDFASRFDAAKERRWGFADLVSAALDRLAPSETQAEEHLAGFDGQPRSLRSFTLTLDALARLESLGAVWRMNRSQVLTVLLDREFCEQGF